jgi:hypothetical protein
MVRTTINLESKIYRKLINESIERHGTAKTLSRIINERLRKPKFKVAENIVKKTSGM